jgi:peptidoglycan/xylan/chitin deacetylase (PgdA/CDA1 family)
LAFSPDRKDTITYAVFAFANAVIALVLLSGAIVTANRPTAARDQKPTAADPTETANANREQVSSALRSYAVVSKKRSPQLNLHVFGLPGAPSLNHAVESRLLDSIEESGGFDGHAAFEPVQTAPDHRWPTADFMTTSAEPDVQADPRTLDISSSVLTAGGRFVVTALRQQSPKPQRTLLLTDLAADTTVDARKLFSDEVDPASVSSDDTGALTVDSSPIEEDDLTDAGRTVSAALHTPLEFTPPEDQRSPDFSCTLLPCVALTYDDGPGEAKTEDALLAGADEADIRLTYYLLGQNIDEFPDVARRIAAAGHEVDNHTDRHQRLDLLSPDALRHEVGRTQKKLDSVGGSDPAFVRPPYGALDKRGAHALGTPAIIWDVDTGDWQNKNPKKIVHNVKKHARPGSVVLMHSIHPTTVKAAPKVFSTVADKGMYAVTVRELFSGIKWEKGGSYFCRGYWNELCSNPEHPSVHKN